MYTVIPDTNFWIYCIQWRIDIVREVERICPYGTKILLLTTVQTELEKLSKEKKVGKFAKIALALAKSFPKEETKNDTPADNVLVEKSKGKEIIIATQDRLLKSQLKCPIMGIKQKKYLFIINQNL